MEEWESCFLRGSLAVLVVILDVPRGNVDLIIIIIMYFFTCHFSKFEHIAHYKAKNKT